MISSKPHYCSGAFIMTHIELNTFPLSTVLLLVLYTSVSGKTEDEFNCLQMGCFNLQILVHTFKSSHVLNTDLIFFLHLEIIQKKSSESKNQICLALVFGNYCSISETFQ